MGDLADVLDLLQATTPRWSTVRADGHEWRHTRRTVEAFESHVAAHQAKHGRGSAVVLMGYSRIGDDSLPPDETDDGWRLWAERSGRRRAQFAIGDEDLTVVFDGPTWWSWSPSRGGMTNRGRENVGHGAGPSEALVDTASLVSALRFEPLATETVAGRAAYVVRGVRRDEDDTAVHNLGLGADEYLLTVDAERGVLLRTVARRGGEPFRVVEMTAVEFDVDLRADTFAIQLAPGETFGDAWSEPPLKPPRMRRLSLARWLKS